jgi:hypothetical protein
MGIAIDSKGIPYVRYLPCSRCNGSGMTARWVDLSKFLLLLEKENCAHQHIVTEGGFHLKAGEVWDDEHEVCSDCGQLIR